MSSFLKTTEGKITISVVPAVVVIILAILLYFALRKKKTDNEEKKEKEKKEDKKKEEDTKIEEKSNNMNLKKKDPNKKLKFKKSAPTPQEKKKEEKKEEEKKEEDKNKKSNNNEEEEEEETEEEKKKNQEITKNLHNRYCYNFLLDVQKLIRTLEDTDKVAQKAKQYLSDNNIEFDDQKVLITCLNSKSIEFDIVVGQHNINNYKIDYDRNEGKFTKGYELSNLNNNHLSSEELNTINSACNPPEKDIVNIYEIFFEKNHSIILDMASIKSIGNYDYKIDYLELLETASVKNNTADISLQNQVENKKEI